MSLIRRFAALLLTAGALYFGVQPLFLKLPFDRSDIRGRFDGLPDRAVPQYPRFLEQVRSTTPRGAEIAILVPMSGWDEGYSYAYYRASYFLAGRRVLPVVSPNDELLRTSLTRAEYIAAWSARVVAPEFKPVWSSDGGTLLVRRR